MSRPRANETFLKSGIEMSWRASRSRATFVWLVSVLVVGCGGDTPAEVEEPVVTSITLTSTSIELTFLNQTVPISATVLDQNGNTIAGTVVWASEDEGVATVTSTGTVQAVANGTTRVTATVGSVSATATITVAQVATFAFADSGDGQDAIAGQPLAQPIVIIAQDAAGFPVDGGTVTFTPDANNGSVSAASVQVGADGRAETVWTLGSPFGPQRLVASIDDVEVVITAMAFSETPTPDLAADESVVVVRPDPSSLETVQVRDTVRNHGDEESGPYRVQLLADGVEVAFVDMPSLAPGAAVEVELQVGPLAAGPHDLTVVVDPDDVILELNEANNEADRALVVTLQTPVTTGSLTGLDLAVGQEILYRLDVPAGSRALTVAISGGSGDADVFVDGGARPPGREQYDDCVGAGPTNEDSCQIVDPAGSYHILIHAPQVVVSGLRLDITLGDVILPFDLELVFVDNGSPSQNAAVVAAAERWMDVLVGDIPDQIFSPENSIEADACIDGQAAVTTPVDDVVIYVSIDSIDGALGVLGRARPCFVRHQSRLPINGLIQFDEADLDRIEMDGDMENVILHEMGHVLGIGSLWAERGLLADPSVPPAGQTGADTHFRGERAIAAFDAAGGVNYTVGAKVPVENVAGAGSGDTHWRESVFDRELMTPFLDAGVFNPMSAVTIQSLADLGYGVDESLADPFTLVFAPPVLAAPSGRRKIDLRGDVAEGPIVVVDELGRVVEILR